MSGLWDFVKSAKWTFLIGAVILVVALVSIIYAVATREGDVGFAKRDGHELKWSKDAFPLSCFYEEGFPQLALYNVARSEFNSRVGAQLLGPCMPWRLVDAMPHQSNGSITLHVSHPPKSQADGVEVIDPFKSHPGATTDLRFDTRNGRLRSAAIYIDPKAPAGDLPRIWIHELGHVLGLDHDRLQDSVMFHTVAVRPNKLSDKDVDVLKGEYR